MRKALLAGLILPLVLAIAGCGGGSSGSSSSNPGSSPPPSSPGANVVTMTVDPGPAGADSVDTPYITVTLCVAGTTTCQTFNDIEVDSGSYGFRILADATDTTGTAFDLPLQQETDSTGNPIVECTQFVDGYSWGPVMTADVEVGGETASGVPVQVIGAPSYSSVPSNCSSTGTQEDTVSAFGANGIIGVGVFAQDCGTACTTTTANGEYYVCPPSGCQPATVALAEQVTNPVFEFPADNNGVIVELPSLGSSGTAATVTGKLVFGIGTEGNNQFSAGTLLTADQYGDITTTFNGQSLPYSYFDTGSNAYYFVDSSISDSCMNNAGWYCPSSTLNLSAVNSGQNGTQSTVNFSIGNAPTLFNDYPTNAAFSELGANAGNQSAFCPNGASNCSFDFGLPFFFGRNVYVAFYGANTSAGPGPYYAY